MANFLGGLLSTVGGAGEGGFKAWGEDIEQKQKTAAEINVDKIKQAAIEKREKNLAQFEHGLESISRKEEFERTQEAEETKYKRRREESQTDFDNQLKAKLASEKQILEMKLKVDENKENTKDQLEALKLCNKVREDAGGVITDEVADQINDIRKRVDLPLLKYKPTGKTIPGKHFWNPDEQEMAWRVGDNAEQQGILSGETPTQGQSEFDRLQQKIKQKGQEVIQPKEQVEGATTKSGLLESAVKEEPAYRTKITEPVSNEQEQAAIKELTDLAHKLGVGPGNWKALASQAQKIGGWAWDAYQKAWNNLISSQKGARETLPAYKK
jgi:hypothetical protein